MDIYNRNRPSKLRDMFPTSPIVKNGDSLITNTLNGELPDLPHFMILHSEYGGLGKTTVGRILAAELNADATDRERDLIMKGEKNPYFKEMNGADFRKIDDARQLNNEIEYKRNSLMNDIRYVYMINEAHQLTKDAQQIFLQLTESLPDNVYVIFTATELSDFNDKLLTRARKYKFTPVSRKDLKKILNDVSKKEANLDVPEYVVDQIFELCGTSIRDSVNTLGEFLANGSIELPDSEKEDPTLFKDLLGLYESCAEGELVSWSKSIVPTIRRVLDKHSPEEIRIKFLTRLTGVITDNNGIRSNQNGNGRSQAEIVVRKMNLYARASEMFMNPIQFPPKVYIITLLFRLYSETVSYDLMQNRG